MEAGALYVRYRSLTSLLRKHRGGATPALGVAEKTGGRDGGALRNQRDRGLWSAGGRPLLI